jgi:flagellar biosynthesis protein FlhF
VKVERIWAPTLPQALAQVKRRLGPEAVILSHGPARPPIWRFWQSWVEVVAADAMPPSPAPPEPAAPPQELLAAISDLRQEVARLGRPDSLVPPPWVHGMARLARRGVGPTLAARLLEAARRAVGDVPVEEAAADEALRTALAAWLAERCDPDPRAPRTVVLVGPTGAGKTTTLAKLAARAVLERGERVGVITADTYRIAAIDQLRTYADILGVPVKVALSAEDLTAAAEAFADMDRVFVDTPGRNFKVPLAMAELGALVRAVRPDAVDLLVPANLAPPAAEELARTFAAAGFTTRFVLTKWDEAPSPAGTFGALALLDRPLAYVTTGQAVPDDLAYPGPDSLARAVWEGGDLT